MLTFSIIVPSVNTSIVNLIDSLKEQLFPKELFEVIIIKGSDNHISFQSNPLNIKVIDVKNTNPSSMRNSAIRQSKGDILAFIDDDAQALEDWLLKASDAFERNPDLAVLAGPALLHPDASFRERLSYEMAHAKFFGNGHDNLSSDTTSPGKLLGHINSCNMFIRKEVLSKIDENFNVCLGYGGEDTLLIHQLLKAKYKILYSCDLKVYHRRRRFGVNLLRQKFIYRINNGLMLWVKPAVYWSHPKFTIGFLGITFFMIFSLFNIKIFLPAIFMYFLISYILAVSYLRKSTLMFFALPIALFLQHIVYYVAILCGVFSVFTLPGLKRIKRLKGSAK